MAYKAKKAFTTEEAKEKVLGFIRDGKTIKEAMALVDRGESTFRAWTENDDDFAVAYESLKVKLAAGKVGKVRPEVPSFEEFCKEYLNNDVFYHQRQWIQLLRGEQPEDLHPSMEYSPGSSKRLVVNTPPGHAKSTTVTVNYSIYNIVKNPDIKIIIISKSQRFAEQFLLQIKERLVSPDYKKLQDSYAPSGGWKGDGSWRTNQFYIAGKGAEAKDPTVQAVGIGGQLYGARADLIIIDDGIDNLNASDHEKQVSWIQDIVASRLSRNGKLLVIGTRIAATDMYSELLNPDNYPNGKPNWTYLKQPAVLEYKEDPRDWVTLWPYTNIPEDGDQEPEENGLYLKRDGLYLSEVKESMKASGWSRIYQQEQVAEDAIFKPEQIAKCIDGRAAGIIPQAANLGRAEGMSNLEVIASIDPSGKHHTAFTCIAFEKSGSKPRRFVLEVFRQYNMRADQMKELMRQWTLKYNVKEWVVESNGAQTLMTRDAEINEWLVAHGSRIVEHMTTGKNKHDADFGVMGMGSLFEMEMLRLPNNANPYVKQLIDELISWEPLKRQSANYTTDMVMSLWFGCARIEEKIRVISGQSFYRNNPFATKGDKKKRVVYTSLEYEREYGTRA